MKIQYTKHPITVFESSIYRTTSSLIDLAHSIVLVDPNTLPIEIDFIKTFIAKYHSKKKLYLLFTHSDYDHIVAYGAFPEATTVGGIDLIQNPDFTHCVQQIMDFDQQYYIQRDYPISYPKIEIKIDSENQSLHIDDYEIIFNFASGHINNGLITSIPQLKLMIVGDYLSNIEIPMVDHSFEKYLETLKKIKKNSSHHNINVMITGHGDIATNNKEILNRLDCDKKYIKGFFPKYTPNDSIFQKTIEKKGLEMQNKIIHQNNINFYNQLYYKE